MFTTNDTYCPATSMTLHTTNPSNTALAAVPNSAQLETYSINSTSSGTTMLNMVATKTGTFTFYLLGKTISDKHVYITFTLKIECTSFSQVLTPTTEDILLLESPKNSGTVTMLSS